MLWHDWSSAASPWHGWTLLRRGLTENRLDTAYAAAAAENPHYPYESAEEREVLRAP